MRIILGLILLLLLTGCQQTGSQRPADAADGGGGQGRLRFFEPEFAALQGEMMFNLADACQTRSDDVQLFDRCLRDRVASAFDDSGEGRKNCAFHAGFGAFLGCVAMGNTFIDVMHRIADDSPLPHGFWTGDDAMIRALSRSIASRGVTNCADSASQEELDGCIGRWFEQRLELASSLTERCPSGDAEGRNTCLVEAVTIRFMQDHVPRLSAVGI